MLTNLRRPISEPACFQPEYEYMTLLTIFAQHLSMGLSQIVVKQENSDRPSSPAKSIFSNTRRGAVAPGSPPSTRARFISAKCSRRDRVELHGCLPGSDRKPNLLLIEPKSARLHEVGFQSLTQFNRVQADLGQSPTGTAASASGRTRKGLRPPNHLHLRRTRLCYFASKRKKFI